MQQIVNPNAGSDMVHLAENLGMNDTAYGVWKETVRMNAIQISNHMHHWVTEESEEKA